MSTKTKQILTAPVTLGELEDFLVYEMGMERSKIVVQVESVDKDRLKLIVPFETH